MLSYGNPEWALNKYNNLVNNFLWDEKPSKYMYGKPDFAKGSKNSRLGDKNTGQQTGMD